MNKRLFITIAISVTFVIFALFLILILCFPDHFPGEPPAGKLEQAIRVVLVILAFPLAALVKIIGKDPPWFWVTTPALFIISGVFWAILAERAYRGLSTKHGQNRMEK